MDKVSQIREKTDIVGLVSEYIPLKKMGRNFKTICPFHNEKTPSFVVSPERQIWHCFGCAKGGDCFSFLMEYEKLEFPEALRILSKRTGIELSETVFATNLSSKKEKIYKLNKLALDFYHYVLTKHHAGKKALAYLTEKRKLDKRLIETFMLGFAPKDGVSLSNYLINKKNHKKEDLAEAGLAFYSSAPLPSMILRAGRAGRTSSGSGVLDFFRNRVMFPLFDHRGNIVGFSGRVMDESAQGGKYVNTKETLVYHKGSMFFGLNTAKEDVRKEDKVIIVEGEFDVISLFSQGVKNTVAVKGTALTENQVNLLSRFTKNVALCFDKDTAGYEATKRSLPILEKEGLTTTVIELENGKDADEAIRENPSLFKKNLKNDISIYDYFFDKLVLKEDRKTIEGKTKSLEMLPIISQIENEIIKEHFLKKLSEALDVSYESIVREMEKLQKKESLKTIAFEKKDKRVRREILEDYILTLIVQSENPKETFESAFEILQDYRFAIPSLEKITNTLLLFFKTEENPEFKKFSKNLVPELTKAFELCFLYPLPKFLNNEDYEKEVKKVAIELRAIFIKDKIRLLSLDLKNKEKEENKEEIEALGKELSDLIYLLSRPQNVVK